MKGLGQVTMSLLMDTDSVVSVFTNEKRVSESSNALNFNCSNEHEVIAAIEAIDKADICPGNPDKKFVSLCRKRGGSIREAKGNGDVIAVVEDVVVEG